MTETPGSYAGAIVPQPSPRLKRAAQLALLMWHPLFTGKCPHCGQAIAQADVSPQQWQCEGCKADSSRPY